MQHATVQRLPQLRVHNLKQKKTSTSFQNFLRFVHRKRVKVFRAAALIYFRGDAAFFSPQTFPLARCV